MRIVKLPDGRLRIPVAAAGEGWAADGTEIIGADDPATRTTCRSPSPRTSMPAATARTP